MFQFLRSTRAVARPTLNALHTELRKPRSKPLLRPVMARVPLLLLPSARVIVYPGDHPHQTRPWAIPEWHSPQQSNQNTTHQPSTELLKLLEETTGPQTNDRYKKKLELYRMRSGPAIHDTAARRHKSLSHPCSMLRAPCQDKGRAPTTTACVADRPCSQYEALPQLNTTHSNMLTSTSHTRAPSCSAPWDG
ncbi:unnamed protein product [Arctogadus glacialis]